MKYAPSELEEVFKNLLRDATDVFDAEGLEWMLIGGLAVCAWTQPRATKDTDFALTLPPQVDALAEGLSAKGFEVTAAMLERVRDGGVVRLTTTGSPLLVMDLLCAGTDFEREALSRRRELTLFEQRLWVASPDDLLVYKLVAGRPHDMADIDSLIRFGRAPEDAEYVRRWAREWDVEARFDAALAAADR